MNKKNISKEFLIKRFSQLRNEFGRNPNRDEMKHRTHIRKYWGNYNEFVRKQGQLPNFGRTKNDYITAVKKIYEEIGKVPTLEFLKEKNINSKGISILFGTYNNLLKECNLQTRSVIQADKTKDELLEEYVDLCNEKGSWVTGRELKSVSIYENRFESLIKLREESVKNPRLTIKDKTIKMPLYMKYTDEDIENYIVNAFRIYGKDMKVVDFKNYLKSIKGCSLSTIEKRTKTTSIKELSEKYCK